MRRTGNSRHVAAIAGEESVARTFVIIRAAYRLMPSLHVGAMSVAKVWPAAVVFKSFPSYTRRFISNARPVVSSINRRHGDITSIFDPRSSLDSRHWLSSPWRGRRRRGQRVKNGLGLREWSTRENNHRSIPFRFSTVYGTTRNGQRLFPYEKFKIVLETIFLFFSGTIRI